MSLTIYELRWRDIDIGTVEEMTSHFTLARQMEKQNESLHYPPYPFSFQTDTRRSSGQFLKLQSKLNHILGRVDNIPCKTPDEIHVRSILCGSSFNYDTKAAAADASNLPTPPNLAALQGGLAQLSFNPPATLQPSNMLLPSSTFAAPPQSPIIASTPTTSRSSFGIQPIMPHK
ncbi:unnamed protein product [Ceutorhynchus assimilis]|uniref:Uncharacterized protein n=1 Tax=Ceutorhynchus assimilis TaxID=467358 RepID=A0A9N9MRY4_9CUCU|nr:unnamed protein product [Ceutorhynchus assimilis]